MSYLEVSSRRQQGVSAVNVKQAGRLGRIENVLAFSTRSARFLVQTLEKEGYAPEGRVRALCISPRVAQALATENPVARDSNVSAAASRVDASNFKGSIWCRTLKSRLDDSKE